MTLTHLSTFWQAGSPPMQLVRFEFTDDNGDTVVQYVEATPEVLGAIDHAGLYLPSGKDCD
jgi:hypothetical protein